jgi:methionyl aminopeptidase
MSGPTIKSQEEIEILRRGGKILSKILKKVASKVKPGITTGELNELAEKLIFQAGGEPSFKGFKERNETPFPTTLCTSLNDEVVHAPALPSRLLKEGDLLKIDIGMKWPSDLRKERFKLKKGLYTDMAISLGVGKISLEAQKLIQVTKQALEIGIKQIKAGQRISEISKAIQRFIEKKGFGIVRDLTGHGVGYQVHEPPLIPNFWQNDFLDSILKEGMVICLEPMVTLGDWRVSLKSDGWTMVTIDNSLAAHFEHTIVVTKEGAEVITK